MLVLALIAALALQQASTDPSRGSLLVAPLELGAAPPGTRAVAAVRVSGTGADLEAERLDRMARSRPSKFEALARLRSAKPTGQASGMFGTVWPSLIADEVEGVLLELEVGD